MRVRARSSEEFRLTLREHRFRAGLSQNALARKAGVDPAYVNRMEKWGYVPSPVVLDALLFAMGVTGVAADSVRVSCGYCPKVILAMGEDRLHHLLRFLVSS